MSDLYMMRAERPNIRSDDAPPRYSRTGSMEGMALKMCRGEWVMLAETPAKSLQRAIRRLGGNATRYKTSEMFYCVKVLDAPWMMGVCVAAQA